VTTTIIVLSVDEAHDLRTCLPAAAAQPDAEVVVIDDACTDATAQVAAEHGARVVALSERVSYAAAINHGLAATGGEHVLLLNADCVLEPGFLAAAVAHMHADPGLASVAPKLVRSEQPERIDAAGMVVDRRRRNRLVGHGASAHAYATARPCFGGDGACVLYRRAALEHLAIDGEVLDEDLGLWASDADLAWRAQLCGWRSHYEPAARARHRRFYSPTTRAGLAKAHRALQFRNRLLMVAKNETASGLARDWPWILGWELLALGHVVLRERHLLFAYRDAWRLLPRARARRRALRDRRAARPAPFGLTPPR
jgi:GT2 family glycosyltransferase